MSLADWWYRRNWRQERSQQISDLDLWNQWVLGKDPRGALQDVFREVGTNAKHFVGFVYADHEIGLSVRVELTCRLSMNGHIDPLFDFTKERQGLIIRADMLSQLRLQQLSEWQRVELDLPSEPEWLSYYTTEELEPIRRIRRLRPLRSPEHPDDIRGILGTKGKKPEVVWARTERLLRNGDLECVLLNQPYQDFGISAGDLIDVRVREVEGGIQSVCVGPSRGKN